MRTYASFYTQSSFLNPDQGLMISTQTPCILLPDSICNHLRPHHIQCCRVFLWERLLFKLEGFILRLPISISNLMSSRKLLISTHPKLHFFSTLVKRFFQLFRPSNTETASVPLSFLLHPIHGQILFVLSSECI